MTKASQERYERGRRAFRALAVAIPVVMCATTVWAISDIFNTIGDDRPGIAAVASGMIVTIFIIMTALFRDVWRDNAPANPLDDQHDDGDDAV